MEMTNKKYVSHVLLVIAVLVLATSSGARGATEYECLGGCYNKCILLQGNRIPTSTTYPCYYSCLNSCRPSSSPPSINYFCQLGCAADFCNTATILGTTTYLQARVPLQTTIILTTKLLTNVFVLADNGNLKQCIGGCSSICQP